MEKNNGKKRRNPHHSEMGENQKDPTQKEGKEKLIIMITRNPISRKSDHQKDKNEIQLQGMTFFLWITE